MKIGVLGTGVVGETLANTMVQQSHDVIMGSRDAKNAKATAWAESTGGKASCGTFAEAAAYGETLFNCTSGGASLSALEIAGAENLKSKTLIDVANPLDFSRGMPPTLSVCNDDSLAEQIQRRFPDTHVVKALNTLTANLMVNPTALSSPGNLFICGNNLDAKTQTTELLKSWGWPEKSIIDLGDITNARGTEQLLPLWIRLMGKLGSAQFNFSIVR